MKVVFISPYLFRFRRGIERFTVDLGWALAQRDVQVHLLTWKEDADWFWEKSHPNLHVHVLSLPPYFKSFWAGWLYAWQLSRLKPDIVNVFFTWHGEEFAHKVFRRFAATNLIIHYPAEQVPHRYQTLAKSRLAREANRVVAVSEYVAQGIEAYLERDPLIITSGVDTTVFHPVAEKNASRQALGLTVEVPILLTVAALERRKGVHKVLEALPMVLEEYPDLLYLVAGEGPEGIRLQRLAASLGVSSSVLFLGNVEHVERYYQSADIFLFLSKGEASPLALLEAMSCGLPVIAANRPPLNTIVTASDSFVDDTHPEEIACRILHFLANERVRTDICSANRQVIIERFSWKYIANQYQKLFENEIQSALRLGRN